MKRETLLLGVLFLAALGLTLWLAGGLDPQPLPVQPETPQEESRTTPQHTGPFGVKTSPDATQGSSTDATSAESAALAAAKPGELQVAVSTPDGSVDSVNAALHPPAGRIADNGRGHFRMLDVPPGTYRLTVWADGFVPSRDSMVTIEAGRIAHQEVTLHAGVRPRGVTVDAESSQPIAGAKVEFVGHATVQSDENGRFETQWAIPAVALENMVVSHPEYDTISLVRHPWGDVQRMQIGLGRGSCSLIGRIAQFGPRELPAEARIRAFMMWPDGNRELRRQIFVSTKESFTLARMTPGAYSVVLDFPGTQLPARTEEVHLGSALPVEVVFPFGGGTKLEGTLLARAGPPLPTRIELIGDDGRSVLEVTSAAGGVFLMEAAPAGRWRLRVHYGNPHFNTEHFEIDEAQPQVLIEVDCDAQRLKR